MIKLNCIPIDYNTILFSKTATQQCKISYLRSVHLSTLKRTRTLQELMAEIEHASTRGKVDEKGQVDKLPSDWCIYWKQYVELIFNHLHGNMDAVLRSMTELHYGKRMLFFTLLANVRSYIIVF